MTRWLSLRLDSIRQRLRLGFGVLTILLMTGGVLGYTALSNMSTVISGTLAGVQEEGLLTARLSLPRARYPGTERIARVGEGTGSRAAADVAVLASAALSVERIGVVQSLEDFRVAVDLDQRVFAHVSAVQRQESGGINFAEVRDEDDAVSVANLEALINGARLHLRCVHARPAHRLDRNAAIRRSFGGLDLER